jgi:hypothetical protein
VHAGPDHGIAFNGTLLKALAISAPASALFTGALTLFSRERNFHALLQLAGSVFLVMVVLTHIAESASSVSFNALGPGAQRWSLSRFLERDSRSDAVSHRIFASGIRKETMTRKSIGKLP